MSPVAPQMPAVNPAAEESEEPVSRSRTQSNASQQRYTIDPFSNEAYMPASIQQNIVTHGQGSMDEAFTNSEDTSARSTSESTPVRTNNHHAENASPLPQPMPDLSQIPQMPVPTQFPQSSLQHAQHQSQTQPQPHSGTSTHENGLSDSHLKKSSSTSGSKGFFGNMKEKLLKAIPSGNEMILPDDSKPTIVWDPVKGRYVGAGVEEETMAAPPPKLDSLSGVSSSSGGLRAARTSGGSRYFNPLNQASTNGAATPPPAPVPTMPLPPQFGFIPTMPDDAGETVSIGMGSSSAQASQQYEGVLQRSLVLLRQLRNRVTRLHNLLFHSPPPTRETWHAYFRRIDRVDKEFRDCFDNLESYAKGLPNQLPQIEPLNRLRAVFQEEQMDVQIMETVESMIDCENWNEGNFQTYMYLGEFLRLQRRRPSCIVPRPLSCSHWATGMSPHAQFETAFAQFQKELLKNKTGIFPTFLERTAVGSIVESSCIQLRFGVLFEKQIVFTQKMLMVENAGVIEQMLFVAPHEEWSFYTDLGEKRSKRNYFGASFHTLSSAPVDLTKPSQYIVYQKLTTQANLHLMQTINTQEFRWTAQTLHQLSSAFGKFQHVFEATCRNCNMVSCSRKVMKDFLPPLIFDFRNLKNALHETCR
ncbi:unnamed protein product [Strongylus vulgaris]|uniref:Uncharacterized protein n=1 Tax=Strongylus vulgaris TaxID=40348 RepID=A0A3P7KXG1_STRVU|nr:unnamed protein product [Strongylus vulgaris]